MENMDENISSENIENQEENMDNEEWDEEFDDDLENDDNEESAGNENNGNSVEGSEDVSASGYENKRLTKRQWMSKNNNYEDADKFHMQLPDKKPRKKRTLLMTEEQQIKKMEKVYIFLFIYI